jgi:hypothetical protein
VRFAICLLAGLLVLAAGQIKFDMPGGARAIEPSVLASGPAQSDPAPKISDARLSGKKLIVTGENFGPGAVIFINGERQKTKNDSDNPSTVLVAKKAGKKMPGDEVVSIQVLSAAGAQSAAFGFFSGRTVTIEDGGKTIVLRVGERFLLALKKDNFEWVASVQDPAVLKKVDDADLVPGAQGIFEAQRVGQTGVDALGEFPCSKLTPPCNLPSLRVDFNFVVR